MHFGVYDLHQGHLGGPGLVGADGSDAPVAYTSFGDNSLSTVKGLETVQHFGPSSVGIDTFYKSKGNIPEVFLRGCGVPEDFIVYMKSLVQNPIDFYSCFISHSTKDGDFRAWKDHDQYQKSFERLLHDLKTW